MDSSLTDKKQSILAASGEHTTIPPFEPEKYLGYLDDSGLTDEQKIEYLQALWTILVTFIDLGFDVNSVQQVLPALDEQDPGGESHGAERRSDDP